MSDCYWPLSGGLVDAGYWPTRMQSVVSTNTTDGSDGCNCAARLFCQIVPASGQLIAAVGLSVSPVYGLIVAYAISTSRALIGILSADSHSKTGGVDNPALNAAGGRCKSPRFSRRYPGSLLLRWHSRVARLVPSSSSGRNAPSLRCPSNYLSGRLRRKEAVGGRQVPGWCPSSAHVQRDVRNALALLAAPWINERMRPPRTPLPCSGGIWIAV